MKTTDKSDNEVIAEFDGWKFKGMVRPFAGLFGKKVRGYTHPNLPGITVFPDWFDYDKNWSSLMPVVGKITNIWATTTNQKMLKECTPTFRAMQNRLGLLEIHGVYEHAVEFIRWYTTQKQTP